MSARAIGIMPNIAIIGSDQRLAAEYLLTAQTLADTSHLGTMGIAVNSIPIPAVKWEWDKKIPPQHETLQERDLSLI